MNKINIRNSFSEILTVSARKKPKFAESWLRKIYGVGSCGASKLIAFAGLSPFYRYGSREMSIHRVFKTLNARAWPVDRSLKVFILCRLWFLWKTGTYRGLRQKQGLPSHGQRTHSNAGTPARMKAENKLFPFSLRVVKYNVMSKFRKEKNKKGNRRNAKPKVSHTKAKKIKRVSNINKTKEKKKIRDAKSRG